MEWIACAAVLVAGMAWDFGRRKLESDRQSMSDDVEKRLSDRIGAVEADFKAARREIDTLKSHNSLRETAIGSITGVKGRRRVG